MTDGKVLGNRMRRRGKEKRKHQCFDTGTFFNG